MQDEVLFSITQVVDDSTGIWSQGEIEYSIPGTLDDYIEAHGAEGVAEIKKMLRVIEGIMDEKLKEVEQSSENSSSDDASQTEAASKNFSPCIIEHLISF